MRRIGLVTVVGVMLVTLVLAYSQGSQRTSQSTQTASQAELSRSAKAKRVLVKELPKNLSGLELKDGTFRISPGFKVVPRTGSTVALMQNEGSGGGSATVDCSCSGKEGSCVPKTTSGGGSTVLTCSAPKDNPCKGECIMAVTMGGNKTRLAIY